MKKLIIVVSMFSLIACTKRSNITLPAPTPTHDSTFVPEMIICFLGGSGDTSNVDTTVIYPTR